MTTIEIKKIARRKVLTATSLLLTILIILFFIGEIRGDFANGFLFFINAITNIHTLALLTILFGLTYIFAGQAGQEIIEERQNIFLISIKYATLIALSISIYALSVIFFRQDELSINKLGNAMSVYFLPLFLKTMLSLLVVWIWATNKMKATKN